MNVGPGEQERLEHLLDAAGAEAQPTHNGWESLPDRLAQLPQLPRQPRWRRTAMAITAAAAAIVTGALILSGLLVPSQEPGPGGTGEVIAQAGVVVRPLKLELTILSESSDEATIYMPMAANRTRAEQGISGRAPSVPGIVPPQPSTSGLALVKDRRMILNLEAGINVVRFSDVAASIDPTSVQFVSTTDPQGTHVVEQSFEYDLATADRLLARSLETRIVCIDRDGTEFAGYLVSYDADHLILTSHPLADSGATGRTHTLSRKDIEAIRIDRLPDGLTATPTLVWKIETSKPGEHDTLLTYICGRVKWRADYTARIVPAVGDQDGLLDIQGWVTIDNGSGATFRDADIKLVAGDVNRIRDPWAVISPQATGHVGIMEQPGPEALPRREELFEYHLYHLPRPTTLRHHQIKQIHLLRCDGVRARRRYLFDVARDPSRLVVQYLVKNTESNHLGLPLPKGQVRFFQADEDGDLHFVGLDRIDHTPVGEELALSSGFASDLAAEQRQVTERRPAPGQHAVVMEARLRNHRDKPVEARYVARLNSSSWEILRSSHPWLRMDHRTISFDVKLPPNSETVIQFEVLYQ